MEIVFENKKNIKPKVSIVLLDWSCRDSFHIFDYLSKQTVHRDQYEIFWIEYYSRRSPQIKEKLEDCQRLGSPPIVDKWIVMDMPENIYYHKHLMYNIGISLASGKIVVICDSDAIVKPTFVDSIIKAFEKNKDIVLHLDEVRNVDKRFYPFNFPSIGDVTGKGCINFQNGLTTGLLDNKDFIHTRNYGACMAALKEDLIEIGGADEHIDYLGHICGPYELTFRLVNKGKKEIWHQNEFLYHVWHPGTDGQNNYLGPHDGRNMSLPALEAIKTKRIMPLKENPRISLLRKNKDIDKKIIFDGLIDKNSLSDWVIEENKLLVSFGRVAYHRKEYAEALRHWKKVTAVPARDTNFLNELGWAYYFNAEYDEAIRIFSEVVSKDKNNPSALVGMGWAHLQRGRFQEAQGLFHKAINIRPVIAAEMLNEAYRGLGFAWDNLKGNNYDSPGNPKRISFALQYYAFKISQKIRRKDFSIPERLKKRLFNKSRNFILKIIKKTGVIVPEANALKGEAEYLAFGGYPCDVPVFKVQDSLDFLLLELPPRYMPMMPNGLAYVHNILLKCGINFQTIDMNIALYHKYHERKLRKKLDTVITDSGYKMVDDPWDNTNMGEWEKPEVIAYFMADLKNLIAEIIQNKPKAVGISLNGNNRSLVKEFVKKLRRGVPGISIVVGGYDCIYQGLGQQLFPDFDYMVIGEAEMTLEPLVVALAKGEKPRDLSGIVSRYDSSSRVWKNTSLLQDLDTIDFPRYQWAKHIWYQDCERKHLIPITGTRGCNWAKCRFCGECFTFRKRNPEKIVDEVEYHTKLGFHTFHFNESDVNGDPQSLHDICTEVIRRKLKVKLVGQLRVDKRNTADYFRHLANAGFVHLRFGVDGWSDNLIRLQNKGYNMGIVFQNLKDCHASGIRTTVNMVIGVPGETEEDVSEAVNNMIKCKNFISMVESFNTLILVYGSEYYRNPEKYKIHFRKDKEEIYRTYMHYVPAEFWYSDDPYIDQEVRMRRLERIILALHKNGVNIGGFASKVVEKLRDEQGNILKKEKAVV